MKRFLAFVFALALCLSVFVGCGDKPNPDKPKANRRTYDRISPSKPVAML